MRMIGNINSTRAPKHSKNDRTTATANYEGDIQALFHNDSNQTRSDKANLGSKFESRKSDIIRENWNNYYYDYKDEFLNESSYEQSTEYEYFDEDADNATKLRGIYFRNTFQQLDPS